MKPLALLIVGVIVGWAASGVDWSREVIANDIASTINEEPTGPVGAIRTRLVHEQIVAGADGTKQILKEERLVSPDFLCQVPSGGNLVGRFQASAYGSPSGHGCYVVDTMTGKTWHVANGQQPQVVTEELSEQSPWLTPDHPTPAGFNVAPTPSYSEQSTGESASK